MAVRWLPSGDDSPRQSRPSHRQMSGAGRGTVFVVSLALLLIIATVLLIPRAPPEILSGGANASAVPVSPTASPTVLVPPESAASLPGSGDRPAVLNGALLEHAVHERVSRVRQDHGLPALGADPALALLARAHSRDMAVHGYFGHRNLQEWDATARGAAAGYVCFRDSERSFSAAITENLFATARDDSLVLMNSSSVTFYTDTETGIAAMAVDAWMASPDHRENILDPRAEREGIGVASDDTGMVFITEDLC